MSCQVSVSVFCLLPVVVCSIFPHVKFSSTNGCTLSTRSLLKGSRVNFESWLLGCGLARVIRHASSVIVPGCRVCRVCRDAARLLPSWVARLPGPGLKGSYMRCALCDDVAVGGSA